MLYSVCACVHTSAYSSYVDICNLWVHYSHRGGKYDTHLRRLQKHMCCPLSHGYQWYPSCSSHNCKTISQFSPTQIYFWCLLIDVSHDFGTVFSMAFTVHVYEWPFFLFIYFHFFFSVGFQPSSSFISLFPRNDFWYYFWIFFMPFSFFFFSPFCNVSPFPLLSFFPTLQGVENVFLSLKSFSQLSCYTRCIAYLRSKTALAFYILFHFFCLGWWFCLLSLSPQFYHSVISPLLPEKANCVYFVFQKCILFNFGFSLNLCALSMFVNFPVKWQ